MKTDGTYKSKNIMMYPDGKYRWVYELNLYKSSAIFSEILKVLGITLVIVMLLMGIFSLMDGDGIMDTLKFLGEMGGILLAIFIPLSIVSYLIYAYVTGGKYCVVFEMDEKGITHIQHPKDVKKTKLIGALTVLAGIAGGRPGIAGTGILAASRTAMHTGHCGHRHSGGVTHGHAYCFQRCEDLGNFAETKPDPCERNPEPQPGLRGGGRFCFRGRLYKSPL